MSEHRRVRSVLISAAAGAACLALATPAWAASTDSLRQSATDPAGANGTVKIDGVPLDDGIDNEPHVTCDFEVDFFNFDEGERANIVFTVHPPTGSDTELLRRDNVLVSDDPASGGKPDPDKTFAFSATQLGLDAYDPHPQQGFHVKLTVERIGAPGAGKHKVFWIEPCKGEASSPPPPPPSTPESPPGGGGGLPVTGPAVGGIALLGGAMVAGGAALLIIRRRRDLT
jgi:LPXTG-motif cell wall-anchored protein